MANLDKETFAKLIHDVCVAAGVNCGHRACQEATPSSSRTARDFQSQAQSDSPRGSGDGRQAPTDPRRGGATTQEKQIMPTINEIWAPFLESDEPIPPLEFLTELFLGMIWDGPSEDIPAEKRDSMRSFAETVIRIAKRAD